MENRKLSTDPKDLSISSEEAITLLAEGNTGALTVLTSFLRKVKTELDFERKDIFDHVDQEIATLKRLRTLDRFRLHGEKFWNFYVTTCNGSLDNLFAFTHGYLHPHPYPFIREKLQAWYEKGEKFDFEKLFNEVRLEEPELFVTPELVFVAEEKEITSEMIESLKLKFNKKK